MINIGITTRSFGGLTNEETARRMRAIGYKCTELCFVQSDSKYWVYNGQTDLSEMSDTRFAEIVATYREQGIEVPALGVFTNLIEPDDATLEKNLGIYRRLMELAAKNGIPYLPTECGFIQNSRGVLAHLYEDRFNRLKASLTKLCEYAKEYDVSLALECCVLDVVPSAKRAADLIEQIGSDRLKVLLDPANLIANSSEEDMFYYLSEHVAYFHGKDRHVNDAYGRLVGDGDINWCQFLALYHQHNDGAPFIIEYAKADNAEEVYNRVMEFDKLAQKML
ncbi:MAG: sugar phosphate isomerase/epimerase [Clostridiaceae bacterium]|nr:sugar phosphate isomerase/epimerase [Clostridiaceae bacterium]